MASTITNKPIPVKQLTAVPTSAPVTASSSTSQQPSNDPHYSDYENGSGSGKDSDANSDNGDEDKSKTLIFWLPCLIVFCIGLLCCLTIVVIKRNKFTAIAPAADNIDNSFESVATSTEQTEYGTKTCTKGEDSMDSKGTDVSIDDGEQLTEGENLTTKTNTLGLDEH